MKSENKLDMTSSQSNLVEYPYRYTSSLTGRPIAVDRLLIPPHGDIVGACLRQGGATTCCQERKACLLYNDTFLKLKRVGQRQPGVYIFFRSHTTPANILYIGQSNDLYSRIVTQNAEGNKLDKLRKTTGAPVWCEVHVMEGPYERFYWEQKWIDKYSPASNRVIFTPA